MRITTAIVAAVVVIGVTGCSLGDKQAKADRVIAAVHRTEASGAARADLTVSAAVLPTRKALAPGPPRIASGAAANVATVIEFKSSRAAVGIAVDDVAHAAQHLLDWLVTSAPPRNRKVQRLKAQARSAKRFGTSNGAVVAAHNHP